MPSSSVTEKRLLKQLQDIHPKDVLKSKKILKGFQCFFRKCSSHQLSILLDGRFRPNGRNENGEDDSGENEVNENENCENEDGESEDQSQDGASQDDEFQQHDCAEECIDEIQGQYSPNHDQPNLLQKLVSKRKRILKGRLDDYIKSLPAEGKPSKISHVETVIVSMDMSQNIALSTLQASWTSKSNLLPVEGRNDMLGRISLLQGIESKIGEREIQCDCVRRVILVCFSYYIDTFAENLAREESETLSNYTKHNVFSALESQGFHDHKKIAALYKSSKKYLRLMEALGPRILVELGFARSLWEGKINYHDTEFFVEYQRQFSSTSDDRILQLNQIAAKLVITALLSVGSTLEELQESQIFLVTTIRRYCGNEIFGKVASYPQIPQPDNRLDSTQLELESRSMTFNPQVLQEQQQGIGYNRWLEYLQHAQEQPSDRPELELTSNIFRPQLSQEHNSWLDPTRLEQHAQEQCNSWLDPTRLEQHAQEQCNSWPDQFITRTTAEDRQ